MTLTKYDPASHRHFLDLWWDYYKHWRVPENVLPDSSYVVFADTNLAGFGSVYITNSKVSIVSWITANPTLASRVRYEALKYLIERLAVVAHMSGSRTILSNANSKGLVKMMKREGYVSAGEHELVLASIGG
jgi:hypothetical protein